MDESTNTEHLIEAVKARGWQDATRTMLDVIEPIAPLVSQFLLVLQPISAAIGAQTVVSELVETLDKPHGIAELRKALDD